MKKETLLMKMSILVIFLFILMYAYIVKSTEGVQQLNHLYLLGKWEIIADVKDDSIKFEDQMISFDENHAVYETKNTKQEDDYVLIDQTLNVFNNKYILDCKTEDYIRLYEDKNTFKILIKWEDHYLNIKPSKELLIGKWNVIYKNYYLTDYEEILEFKDNHLIDYRNDSKYISSDYLLDEQNITVNELNKTYYLYPLTHNEIIFIELDTYTVWKLERVNNEESNV